MPLDSIRPSTLLKLVLMPCARAMCWLQPVARSEEPSSVPKNQYSMTINATTNTAEIHIARGMYISDMSRLYLRTLIAWLAEPSMRRLIEYSASWVSIPASIAGIPMNGMEYARDKSGQHTRDEPRTKAQIHML